MADWQTFNSVNGFLTTMVLVVPHPCRTRSSNCGFSFIATFAGSNTIAIPVPSVAAVGSASPSVPATGNGTFVCVNDNGTAVCS